MLSQQTRTTILKLQQRYPVKRSALIPALHVAQAEVGYLPKEIQREVAELFEIDANEVNALVTFYDMFQEEPKGRHIIHVCKNLSCMLRGCDRILDRLCEILDVSPGGTSADGEFTIIPSECLAACDKAPMLLVDDQVIGPVQEGDLEHILAKAKEGAGHPSPVEEFGVNHG